MLWGLVFLDRHKKGMYQDIDRSENKIAGMNQSINPSRHVTLGSTNMKGNILQFIHSTVYSFLKTLFLCFL